MTATNHAVTGALIASVIPNPVLGLPLAFLSHFALDALPHYGNRDHTSRVFLYTLAADAGMTSAIVLSTIILQPAMWGLPVLGALIAMSPDLMWLPRWLKELARERPYMVTEMDFVLRFHKKIQWFEKPIGLVVEAVWFTVFGALLLKSLA